MSVCTPSLDIVMTKGDGLPADDISGRDQLSPCSSDSEQHETYTVEEILAERFVDDSHPQYLVRWANYGEERCGFRLLF